MVVARPRLIPKRPRATIAGSSPIASTNAISTTMKMLDARLAARSTPAVRNTATVTWTQ